MAEFTGQTYGQATQQMQAQRAVPTGTTPVSAQAQQMAAQGAANQPRPVPGAQPLLRPSERPDEPITAGADFGPGPGSVEAGVVPRIIQEDDVLMRLREVYRMYPNEGLRMLISRYSGMSI
jgi:hypothetical protein